MLKNRFIIIPIWIFLGLGANISCAEQTHSISYSVNNSKTHELSKRHEISATAVNPSCKFPGTDVALCFNNTCPAGTPSSNYLIDHDIYVLSSNATTKLADWVSYKVDKANLNGTNNSRKFKADPCISPEDTLVLGDYKKAFDNCGYDKGHQAPIGDFTNNLFADKANYLSNITPQESKLNQRGWERLEVAERNLANTYKDIYVVTGPYYKKDSNMCPLPFAQVSVTIPSGYWKVIVVADNVTKKYSYVAFSFEQKSHDTKYCKYLVKPDGQQSALSQIQSLSGLDLFPHYNNFANSDELLKALKCDKDSDK